MKIIRPRNTKEKGLVEFLVYKERDKFVGVCLTFDIVEEGSNPKEVMRSITEASALHLKTVVSKNLPDELLNRYAPNEYWEKYFTYLELVAKARLGRQRSASAIQSLPYNNLSLPRVGLAVC